MGVCPTLKCSLAIDHKIQSRSVLKKAGLVVRERRNVKRPNESGNERRFTDVENDAWEKARLGAPGLGG